MAVRTISGPCRNWPEESGFIRELLDRIGDKWTLLVIGTLAEGALRYSDLQASIPGISQRMLTLTLKNLERDGLLTRTAYAEVPPRVEYELSAVGRTLIGPAVALAEWAVGNYPQIETARAAYDAR